MTTSVPHRNSRAQRFTRAAKMRIAVAISRLPLAGRARVVEELAAANGTSARQCWRWFAEFKQRGSEAFTKRTRCDKGRTRYFESHPHVAARVARLWASRWSARAIAEELWFEMLEPPSYSTVRSFVRMLEQTRTQ